ncbi:hypothetical protein OHA04_45215 (plasmid) [Streptomyces sp. NBC_01590]|uniref:hypothetical protein n=1 Tax=Streptomyces sp. NBC_01590 TaxID=2975887 RepID=UPI002F911F28
MTTLNRRVDWDGNVREATAMEVDRAEGTAARIQHEVAEMRAAAEQLSSGGPFEAQVAEFLTVQATMLERAGSTAQRADSMRREEDTVDESGAFPTAARSALLIARACLAKA